MNKAEQRALLTTPYGHVLPEICFRGQISRPLDKLARAYLNARHKHVYMYDGNLTFPQKSYTLFDHNGGLMDTILVQSKIKAVLHDLPDAPRDHVAFVKQIVQGIPMHDDGEGILEPMTFMLKMTNPELVPHAKRMEQEIAPALYGMALCAAVHKKPGKFLSPTHKIQKKLQQKLSDIPSNVFAENFFAAAIDETLTAVHQLNTEMMAGLTKEQLTTVTNMVAAYNAQYEAIEKPESPEHGAPQKFIKIVDKNCNSYNMHARARYRDPHGITVTHDRFLNQTTLNDLVRAEKPLISYMTTLNGNCVAEHFASTACDITFGRMSDYTVTMRPVVFGKMAPEETALHAPRNIWLNETYLPQMELVKQNREGGKHFLQDDVKTNLEIYALLKTKHRRNEHLDHSIFNTNVPYSREFAAEAQNIVDNKEHHPYLAKHADYNLPAIA